MLSNDSYRIVLVDDNPLLREELKKILAGEPDLKVIGEVGDGIALFALLERLSSQKKPLPHLVILDISMPYLNGIETARQMKIVSPYLKILFLSSYSNKEYLDYAINGGAEGYLLKDEMDTEFLPAIRTIREGRFYVSPGFRNVIPDSH